MAEHFCLIHNCKFYKNEKEGKVWYSHKIKDGLGYCNEPKAVETATPQSAPGQKGQLEAITPNLKPLPERSVSTNSSIERQVSLKCSCELADSSETEDEILQRAEKFFGWLQYKK